MLSAKTTNRQRPQPFSQWQCHAFPATVYSSRHPPQPFSRWQYHLPSSCLSQYFLSWWSPHPTEEQQWHLGGSPSTWLPISGWELWHSSQCSPHHPLQFPHHKCQSRNVPLIIALSPPSVQPREMGKHSTQNDDNGAFLPLNLPPSLAARRLCLKTNTRIHE